MPNVIYRTEDDGLPPRASGYVVARDSSGQGVTLFTVDGYRRTTAEPIVIEEAAWQEVVQRAMRAAVQTGGTVYVIWG
jgi:hypothetical protein